MKLLDTLFEITAESSSENNFSCSIIHDPNHSIYSGHFPGYPVTPAVIQVQILQELIEWKLQREIQLSSIKSSKFLKVINPKENSVITVNFTIISDGTELESIAYIEVEKEIYSKLSVIFKLV